MKFSAILAAAVFAADGASAAILRGNGHEAAQQAPMIPMPPMSAMAGTEDAFVREILMKIQADPASLGGIAGVMKPMVEKLLKQVADAHTAAGTGVTAAIAEFAKCKTGGGATAAAGTTSAADLEKALEAAQANVTACGAATAPMAATLATCDQNTGLLKTTHSTKCSVIKATAPTVGDVGDLCSMITGDTTESWLKRMAAAWEAKYDAHTKLVTECKTLQETIDNQTQKCTQEKAALKTSTGSCSTATDKLQQTTCALKQALGQGCADYAGCHERAAKAFEALKTASAAEADTRKAQYAMYKRLECLVNTFDFATGQVDQAKMDACLKATYSTDQFTMAFPDVPAKTTCEVKMPASVDAKLLANCKA